MEPFKMHCIEIKERPASAAAVTANRCAAQIQAIFDYGRESLKQAGGPPLEAIGAAFQAATGHLQAARKWTPDLVEELEGIAEGAGVDLGVLWAFQCQDEILLVQHRADSGSSPAFRPGPLLQPGRAGQGRAARPCWPRTWTPPPCTTAAQTLLHIRYPDTQTARLTWSPNPVWWASAA